MDSIRAMNPPFVPRLSGATRPRRSLQTMLAAAVRGDSLCQLALLAVKLGRRLTWDPAAEQFPNDAAANALLQPRPFRGEWRLPPA